MFKLCFNNSNNESFYRRFSSIQAMQSFVDSFAFYRISYGTIDANEILNGVRRISFNVLTRKFGEISKDISIMG